MTESRKCSSCGKTETVMHASVDLSGAEKDSVPKTLCTACVTRLIKGESESS